jgi:hypothetical protein
MDIHKAETYYHGIANCHDDLARKILAEGLTIDPKRGERWGASLQPQEAVYLTINLAMALGYAGDRAAPLDLVFDSQEDLVFDSQKDQIPPALFVAVVDGRNLTANIEIDEDHLSDMLQSGEYSYLKPESVDWINDYIDRYPDMTDKEMIHDMPAPVAYDILDQFPNLAHYANTPVTKILKWKQAGQTRASYISQLMQSCATNKPVGAIEIK